MAVLRCRGFCQGSTEPEGAQHRLQKGGLAHSIHRGNDVGMGGEHCYRWQLYTRITDPKAFSFCTEPLCIILCLPSEALAILLHLQSTAELTAGNRNKENAEFLLVQRI